VIELKNVTTTYDKSGTI